MHANSLLEEVNGGSSEYKEVESYIKTIPIHSGRNWNCSKSMVEVDVFHTMFVRLRLSKPV